MKNPFYILIISLSFVALTNTDCKKNPVAPPPPISNDTTSNNFTFQTFTFGGNAGSCSLTDVAIINDTNIWAVGYVYLDSSNGVADPFPYNAAHWDGKKWTLQKILYQGIPPVIHTIYTFNDNDIWFDPWFHWNGQNIQQLPIDPALIGARINKMWGISSNDFYSVGNNGFIAHYNGTTWTKITTGTSLAFYDIYGSGGQILAVCSQNYPFGEGIYSITGTTATSLTSYPSGQHDLASIWFVPNQQYYLVGDGIFHKQNITDSAWENDLFDLTNDATTAVRGTGINDVFIVGAFGEFLHWNGVRWKSFIDQTGLSYGCYGSIAISSNLVVTVGYNNNQAVITMGTRH